MKKKERKRTGEKKYQRSRKGICNGETPPALAGQKGNPVSVVTTRPEGR